MSDDLNAEIFHIVITDGGELLLVKRPGADWRALQDEFADFKTSLGPYDIHDAMEMIEIEWPDVLDARAAEIASFAASTETMLKL